METNQQPKLNRSGWLSLLSPYRWLVIQIICFFLAMGRLDYYRGWIVYGVAFVGSSVSIWFTLKYLKNLANQRGKPQTGTKKWDLGLISAYFLIHLIGFPIVAGLDLGRYNWSYLGWSFFAAGIFFYVFTFFIVQWAMLINPHFEGTVRIQEERDHQVITAGPYRYVRHPGYVGMVTLNISLPLMFGSLISFIPAGVCVIIVLIRTGLEDSALQRELPGYRQFTEKTRFRLLPGIW